jgi:hypothetical protein
MIALLVALSGVQSSVDAHVTDFRGKLTSEVRFVLALSASSVARLTTYSSGTTHVQGGTSSPQALKRTCGLV